MLSSRSDKVDLMMPVTDECGFKQDVPILASAASNTRPWFCIPVWPLNHHPIHSKPRYFSRTVCLACLSRRGGGRKQRSRVEQLELEMRRSCGGMRARGAMTRGFWLKIHTHKVLMRGMRRLQWWRSSCGCVSKIRACVPPSCRVCCLSPLSRYFPFKSSDCLACSASSNERASQDLSFDPGWNQKPSATELSLRCELLQLIISANISMNPK